MDMMTLSNRWHRRPDDAQLPNLDDLVGFKTAERERSRATVIPSRALTVQPVLDDPARRALAIVGPDGTPATPTHWSFGQLAGVVGAPAAYLRKLPSDIVADCINYGIFERRVEDTGVLLRQDGHIELAAVTGPNYGRVWDADIAGTLRRLFGNGLDGDFTLPSVVGGAPGQRVPVYASDRDMFVFLCDENNRIEIKDRRNGRGGSLSLGFILWNSEVGSKSMGIATFVYDYVCGNRLIMGMRGYEEIAFRHTVSAPTRWLEEMAPAIEAMARKETHSIREAVEAAQAKRIDADSVDEFLRKRFTKGQASGIMAAHMAEEDRPIESLWDVTVGVTAYAKGITWQDERVGLERAAGKVLALAQ